MRIRSSLVIVETASESWSGRIVRTVDGSALEGNSRVDATGSGAVVPRLRLNPRALGAGAMTCWSGYYHGVIEGELAVREPREGRDVRALPVRPRPGARVDDLQRRRPSPIRSASATGCPTPGTRPRARVECSCRRSCR